jgi:hypothetical protein
MDHMVTTQKTIRSCDNAPFFFGQVGGMAGRNESADAIALS